MAGMEALYVVNPGKKRKRSRRRRAKRNPGVADLFSNPRRRRSRARRAKRNPAFARKRPRAAVLVPKPMDFLYGGAGVVGTEMVAFALKNTLPANPWIRAGVKAGTALAISAVVGSMLGKRAGYAAGVGAGGVVAAEIIGLALTGGKSTSLGQFPKGYAQTYFPIAHGAFGQYPKQIHGSGLNQYPTGYNWNTPVQGF